ncbi:MAG: zinc metalloprotease HtpX [Ketobacteraceae bacterium]|nr:zinc metalloprotease HtpX [Ketobacteraceae bacterium]
MKAVFPISPGIPAPAIGHTIFAPQYHFLRITRNIEKATGKPNNKGMPLSESTLKQATLKNQLHTIGLLALMGAFSWQLGSWLFGPDFAFIAVVMGMAGLLFAPAVSTSMLMKAYNASPLTYESAPELNEITRQISKRAGLRNTPELYYVPVGTMNAFATGNRHSGAIGLSHGLLQNLSLEEIAGVLAHEISHIRYNDTRVMAVAETFGNITRTLSLMGQITLLFSLPMILMGMIQISLIPLILIILAPTLAALIQLAISRRREFQADMSSAELLGTPEPLIRALAKLDRQNSYWERFYRASSDNSLLRTHPKTGERIAALRSLYQTGPRRHEPLVLRGPVNHPWQTPISPRRVSRYFWF